MRTGVTTLPPFVLSSTRFLVAGTLMLAACAARGLDLRQTRREWRFQIAIGVLTLGLGNTGVAWAEQYLASGLVSLLVAVIPLYIALMEWVLPGGEGLRAKGWAGIGLGFAGLVVLMSPHLRAGLAGGRGELAGLAVAVSAPLAWSAGSILSRRAKFRSNAFVSAGWQMLIAGVFCFMLIPVLAGGRHAVWTRGGVLSVAYLIVFGSFVGYTSYIYLLEKLPVAKVSTYAYVNPVVAVLLGAALLGERLGGLEYAGMGLILVAVYLVTSSKVKVERPVLAVAGSSR